MREVLIKVKDKETLLQLKQFGEVEIISYVFNTCSMIISDSQINEIRKMDRVLSIEDDECFHVQYL